MKKYDLRNNHIQQRTNYLLTKKSKEEMQRMLEILYETEDYKCSKLIFTYINMEEELDTVSLIKESLLKNKEVALPAVEDKKNMGAYLVNDISELSRDKFGMLSPDPSKATLVDPKDIDLAIVPLLAYDLHGYRLGYGGGYYDRYLPKLSSKCKKIGHAIKELEVKRLPIEIHDYPLDAILTPQGFVNLIDRVETHCHCSEFSRDCFRPFAELLKEAEQKKYSVLTLTDHYDKDVIEGKCYPGYTRPGEKPLEKEWTFAIEEYVDFCLEQKENLRNRNAQIEFLMGIELGYQNYLVDDYNKMTSKYPFDCIVGAIHTMKLIDFAVLGEALYGQGKEKAYQEYLEKLIEMVESKMDFDILAHFDYVTRYSGYEDPNIYYKDYPELFDQLFKAIISRKICLEVNTRTRYKQLLSGEEDKGISDINIYHRYYQLGGRMISFATDAHASGELHTLVPDSINIMKEIGFTQGTYFKNRQACFYDLF